ncbi:MAG TPA: hypothetical protein VFV38_35575 [Ktedonobacteraceae bacterium]|nr:hypothetical protein [Ktedonobacteraceae bacterium]
MRVAAITIEILLSSSTPVERSLPELPQVGVDKRSGVTRPAEAVGERAGATGPVARSRLRPTVARPDQPILLIIPSFFVLIRWRALCFYEAFPSERQYCISYR